MILLDSKPLEVAATEHNASKIRIDGVQQALRGKRVQRTTGRIFITTIAIDAKLSISSAGVEHITARSLHPHIIHQSCCARTPKRLNSINLALFHFLLALILDERNLLAPMDMVLQNIMPCNIPHSLDGQRLPPNVDLIALHGLLNRRPDVTHPRIDARVRDTRIRRIPDRSQQRIERVVEADRKCRIDDAAIHMDSEVHTQNIAGLEQDLAPAGVGRPVSSDIVQAQTRRES